MENIDFQLERLPGDSVVQQVYGSLRSAIASGQYPLGQKLVEAHLAEELGVSRGPLREALRRLGEEGLVVHLPRRGTFVREFSLKDLVDISNLRGAVETVAAREIVRRRAPLESAAQLNDELENVAHADQRTAFIAHDLRFHEELCRISGNAYVTDAFRALSAQIRMAMAFDERSSEELSATVGEHRKLLRVLRGKDELAAATAVQLHVVKSMSDKIERHGADPTRLLPPLGRGR